MIRCRMVLPRLSRRHKPVSDLGSRRASTVKLQSLQGSFEKNSCDRKMWGRSTNRPQYYTRIMPTNTTLLGLLERCLEVTAGELAVLIVDGAHGAVLPLPGGLLR